VSKSKKKTKSKKNAAAKSSKKRSKNMMRGMESMMRDVISAVGGSMAFRHAAR
jgi:hypothetical protein